MMGKNYHKRGLDIILDEEEDNEDGDLKKDEEGSMFFPRDERRK